MVTFSLVVFWLAAVGAILGAIAMLVALQGNADQATRGNIMVLLLGYVVAAPSLALVMFMLTVIDKGL